MPRRPRNRPTDGELAILRVLWEQGPSTVRQVHAALSSQTALGASQPAAGKSPGAVGYTTVLKLLQIMTDKALVVRDESRRAHVYQARASRRETETHLVRDLLERAFDGSTGHLLLRALDARPASPAEIEEIRQLLDAYDQVDKP